MVEAEDNRLPLAVIFRAVSPGFEVNLWGCLWGNATKK